MEMTGHCVWSHDAGAIMQKTSHLKLMSMGCLQACSFFLEQMPDNVSIDINKFLGAFSIDVEGESIHPPSWTQSENNSISTVPTASTISNTSSSLSPPIFNMDDYRRYRQAEAIRWIDLQERRASIIARLQPTTREEYQKLREAVMTEQGQLSRKLKKHAGKKETLLILIHS
jgi:hypothetical protein